MEQNIKSITGFRSHVGWHPRKYMVGKDTVQAAFRLPWHESAACCLLIGKQMLWLQSYDTVVAEYNKATGEFKELGKWSVTTSRQVSWFAHHIRRMYA